jgi:hypothetical protein
VLALLGVILLLIQANIQDKKVTPFHVIPNVQPTQTPEKHYVSLDGHKLS